MPQSDRQPDNRKQARALLALQLLLMLYSLAGVFSKVASGYPLASPCFLLAYGGMVGVLGVYAIGWQQIIKRVPLTTAYANRAVTVIWGIVWGLTLFHEPISVPKIVGALIVLVGVALFALADREVSFQDSTAPHRGNITHE